MPADVVATLADLVSIPSVNPMGGPLSDSEHGEAAVAAYVADFLGRCGLDVETQQVARGRENVLAVAEGRDRTKTLLLETHMDTVGVESMTVDPFFGEAEDDRLYGRGACDAKASLAAMLVAVEHALARGVPPTTVALCAVADEEATFGGAARLVQSGFRATWAVVGEPTRLDVIVAHKGASRWRLRTEGRSAHGATPHEGINAIYRMARVVGALEQYADDLSRRPGHPQLGPPTLNVGTITGGETVNTVPAWCEILVDRRTLPGESPDGVDEELRAWLHNALPEVDCLVAGTLRALPLEGSEGEPWARRVLQAAQRARPGAAFRYVGYSTDASRLAHAGMVAVVAGPGDERQAHTADEWVALDQVRQAVNLYEELLTQPPG